MKYVHVLNQYLKSVYVSLVQLYVAHIQYIHHTYIHTYIHTTLLAPLAKVGGMRYSTRLSKVRIHRGPSPPEQFWCMYIHGGADRGDDILLAPHRAARQIHVEGRKEGNPHHGTGMASTNPEAAYLCMYAVMYVCWSSNEDGSPQAGGQEDQAFPSLPTLSPPPPLPPPRPCPGVAVLVDGSQQAGGALPFTALSTTTISSSSPTP